MSEQNKALVRQAYDNFKAGRIDRLLGLMSPDISWTLPQVRGVPFGGRMRGLAGVGEFFVMVNTFQANHHFETPTLIAEGDKVVVLGSYSWQLRATKKEFSSDFAHVWTFRNGKIITFQEYTDTAALGYAYQGG